MPVWTINKSNISLNDSFFPERIVSLVPSQTELLYDLGLDEEVVGITKFCIHPKDWFGKKPRVGGTKTVKTDVVKALRPDLIIANKEENVREQIEELQQIAPVLITDINTLDDALEMTVFLGKAVNKESRANELVNDIKKDFGQIKPLQQKTEVAYLIWKDPYMAAGGDTFIGDLLRRCGFTNIFQPISRYPEICISKFSTNDAYEATTGNSISQTRHGAHSALARLTPYNCQLLLLSSEPYPFKQKHADELQMLLPFTKIMLVDGEAFSWYGSRLLHSARYFKNLIEQIQG